MSAEHAQLAGKADNQTSGLVQISQAIFRNFSVDDFRPTASWRILAQILRGNGGCFGLYGPRGSGKSWLMRMAIEEVEHEGGIGLWFPCPSKYDASDFLSALSDNLANAVERRFSRRRAIVFNIAVMRNLMAAVVIVGTVLGLLLSGISELIAESKSGSRGGLTRITIFPTWTLITVAAAAFLFLVTSVIVLACNAAPSGNVLRSATSLRERIRFTESLKLGVDLSLSAGKSPASLRRMRERTLDERPASVASLVFDFRNLVAQISKLRKPLVICIDELDKIEDIDEVRSLLRDIKGIFEVSGTHFFVSISEEAATSLQIGMLKSGGRNELNSSFYSVIALPPMSPAEADDLLSRRQLGQTARLANVLCLLAGGNRRELVRMADLCATYARQHQVPLNEYTIIDLLAEESFALLQEITRDLPEMDLATPNEDVKYRAWMALPREAFHAPDSFIRLGHSAIREHWEPLWASTEWARVREPWRRLLVRLFIAARVLPPTNDPAAACLLDEHLAVTDLRDISVMATRDSGVARLMLLASFGGDLSQRYRPQRQILRG